MSMKWTASTIVSCAILSKHTLLTKSIRGVVSLSYTILGECVKESKEIPLFIVHGLLESKKQWNRLAKTIAGVSKRPVVAVDLRNHGESPHSGEHRYESLAMDVVRLLEKLEVDRATLIGHNMGGRVSMCVALLSPKKIAGIMISEISPASSPAYLTEYYPKVLEAMKAVNFKNPKNVQKARKEAKRQLKKIITDEALMRCILANVNLKRDNTIGWICNIDSLIKEFHHIASFPRRMKGKKYEGPTLFIGGQLSEFIPPDDLTKIRDYFPHATIHYVAKVGHHIHKDDPESFLEYVISFLRHIDIKGS